MTRVVIDTNVLVSALQVMSGNEAAVLQAIRDNRLIPCASDAILLEFRTVLSRPRFGFAQADVGALIRHFENGIHTDSTESSIESPDPSDTKFIACAITARADFLVTGNRRHFPEPRYGIAEVVNARTLLDRLQALV